MSYQRPKVDTKTAEKARPRLGTQFGDEFIGTCAHPLCARRIRRAEPFIVTQAGDVFDSACWAKVECKDLAPSSIPRSG